MSGINVFPTRYVTVIAFGIIFLFSICWADEKKKPIDHRNRESYSLGYQFGLNLKGQSVDLNLDMYNEGVRDGLVGKEPQISQEEIRATIAEMQKRLGAARQAEQKEKTAKNLAEAKVFLEENKKKEGVKVLPSGLQYKVLKEGEGKIAKETDTVTVHYRGTLIDGKEFDSSLKRGKPATFKVTGVIKGWTEALQLMKEGARWQLFIPPDLAYGDRGNAVIGPNSTLIFEVELISAATAESTK